MPAHADPNQNNPNFDPIDAYLERTRDAALGHKKQWMKKHGVEVPMAMSLMDLYKLQHDHDNPPETKERASRKTLQPVQPIHLGGFGVEAIVNSPAFAETGLQYDVVSPRGVTCPYCNAKFWRSEWLWRAVVPFLHASRRSINIFIATGVPDSSVGVDVPTSITGKHIFAPDIGKGLKSFVFPCCHNGEIHLPKLRPASEAVERLLRDGSFGKFFRKHIRVINNSFAMASTTIQQIRNQRGNPGMIIAGKFTHLIQSDFADKCTNFHLSRAKNYRSSVTYIEPAPPPVQFPTCAWSMVAGSGRAKQAPIR